MAQIFDHAMKTYSKMILNGRLSGIEEIQNCSWNPASDDVKAKKGQKLKREGKTSAGSKGGEMCKGGQPTNRKTNKETSTQRDSDRERGETLL